MRSLFAIAIASAAVAGSASAAAPVRTCAQGIGSTKPSPVDHTRTQDLFVGHRLLLIGALAATARTFESGEPGWYWWKSLAAVRNGRDVTLTVPRSERRRFRLRYANGQKDTSTVTIHPCAAGRWSYFPGGFTYTRPGCYALDIRIRGHRARRKWLAFGEGASCSPS